MTDAERCNVIKIAHRLLDPTPEITRLSREEKRAKLRESAELAVDFYLHDKELTEWTVLDGEDFIDE